MILRLILASVIGGFLWWLETIMTHYSDFISVTLSAIMGTFISGLAALLLAVLFLPVVLTRVWLTWRKLWPISVVMFCAGIALAIISRLPFMLQEGAVDSHTVYTAHPCWYVAWLFVLFSIVTFPFLGISESKRWI